MHTEARTYPLYIAKTDEQLGVALEAAQRAVKKTGKETLRGAGIGALAWATLLGIVGLVFDGPGAAVELAKDGLIIGGALGAAVGAQSALP